MKDILLSKLPFQDSFPFLFFRNLFCCRFFGFAFFPSVIPGPLIKPFSGVVSIVEVVDPEERIKYIANQKHRQKAEKRGKDDEN